MPRRADGFYPRSSILYSRFLWLLPLVLALCLSGCSPSGPHALLKGKKLLDRGDYAGAVAQLKTAASLLATNAQAWNYLGVAYHHAGRPADAAVAYQRALALDRDLVEAHYNLGCLWLEQNKPDAAKTEFTAYTLRRSNAPEGWLKLGLAQLRTRELVAAEKSFSTVLNLAPNDAGALNGLGLVQVERGRPREAMQDFNAAVKAHPDYAPALLNLATMAQEQLRDARLALQYYRAYLALTPRPANWDEVNALVRSLEPPAASVTANPSPPKQNRNATSEPLFPGERKTPPAGAVRPAASPRAQSAARTYSNPPPEVVRVQPEPVIVATPGPVATGSETPVEIPAGAALAQKPGIWHRLNPVNWFRSSAPAEKYDDQGVTVLPPTPETAPPPASPPSAYSRPAPLAKTSAPPAPGSRPVTVAAARPVKIVEPAPSAFPRYLYLSPRKPAAGDRQAATGAFTQAREFEQAARWPDAMKGYQRAAELDPAWFEAQYNFGVLSYHLRDFQQALAADEMALAIRPDSVDARYNFALALRGAGYITDAVRELEKIVAAHPDEVRAHLALGNLYAQQLHDAARARQEYLKVLALDPANPQAGDIHFWLSANPP